MLVPIGKMEESLQIFHDEYDIYPLWLCPYRAYKYEPEHRCFLRAPSNLLPNRDHEMYVDLGAYGIPRAVSEGRNFSAIERGRAVEDYVRSINGFQMLYADSYMTENEFEEMFDHTHYDQMKAKYDPTNAFPRVFDKTCKSGLKKWENHQKEKGKDDDII